MAGFHVGITAGLIAAPTAGLTALAVLIGGIGNAAAADPYAGQTSGSVCATSGPIAGLSSVQAQNARVVAATASGRAGARAALIAVMTGLAESGLRVLGNPNDPSGNGLPIQGVGYNYDSLGIFQQRPSWGTAAQRMDPVTSTNLFLDALLSHSDWASMEPWQAAQEVQQSAYTGIPSAANGYSSIYGGNYLAQEPTAARIVGVSQADSAKLNCGGGVGAPPAGPVDATGLPVGYTVPAGTSAAARIAVTFALAQRGKPYLWGGAGPNAYDCSGLTMAAWAAAGIQLAHDTRVQISEGSPTVSTRLLPGDLVLTPGSDGTIASPGHVGMFIGDGLVIEAPHSGDVVKVVSYQSFVAGGLSGLRHIA